MHVKPRAVGLLLCALTPVTVAGSVSASAAPAKTSGRVVVEIAHRALVADDGGATVILRSRCPATFQAFELNVSLTQPNASGHASQLAPPAVLSCDGKRHRTEFTIHPDLGSFVAGAARVDVYVGFYDSVAGHDVEATDSQTVRLSGNRASPPDTT